MNVWGITDRGKIREQNQDAFAHQVLPDGRVIALVCDGMGGARAGNIASSMAVDVFMEAFLEDGEDSPDLEHMERAAARANRQVFRRAVEDENCVGMGTTLVAALAGEEEALIPPRSPGTTPWWRTWWSGESSPGIRPGSTPTRI